MVMPRICNRSNLSFIRLELILKHVDEIVMQHIVRKSQDIIE